MSTLIAQPAINTIIQYGDGASPQVWTTIGRVGDVGVGMSGTVVDVTAMDNDGPWSQSIVTILNGGPITIPVFYLPNDAGHEAVLTLFEDRGLAGVAGDPIPFRIVWPTTPAHYFRFSGFFSDFTIKAAVKGILTADLKIVVSSSMNLDATANQ